MNSPRNHAWQFNVRISASHQFFFKTSSQTAKGSLRLVPLYRRFCWIIVQLETPTLHVTSIFIFFQIIQVGQFCFIGQVLTSTKHCRMVLFAIINKIYRTKACFGVRLPHKVLIPRTVASFQEVATPQVCQIATSDFDRGCWDLKVST